MMIDKTRKDRDYLWGRIFGEISLWMDRAPKLTGVQKEIFVRDWDLKPMSTFKNFTERYVLTVIEAGAARGEEDRRIGEIFALGEADMWMNDTPLGSDAHLAYYHERG